MKPAVTLSLSLACVLSGMELRADDILPGPGRQTAIRQIEALFRQSAKIPAFEGGDTESPPPYLKVISGEDERSSLIYRCRYTKAQQIVDPLESIVSHQGTVEQSEDQNLIIINDVSSKMEELKQAVLALDIYAPQILVEAKVVEVVMDEGMEREMEAQFEKFDAAENLTYTFGDVNLDAPSPNPLPGQGGLTDFFPYSSGRDGGDWSRLRLFVRWLETVRDVKILSSPNLIVDLNSTASIITGEEIPIQSSQVVSGAVSTSIAFKRIGVKLNVTPQLINEDRVRLMVNPDVSTVTSFVSFTQAGVTFNNPIIAIRNIKTTLTAKDGEIIMLGGLYSSEEVTRYRRPPFLAGIPILDELFSSKYKSKVLTQLIFFLKVHVLPEGVPDGQRLHDPEKAAAETQAIGDIIQKSPTIFPRPQSDSEEFIEELSPETQP